MFLHSKYNNMFSKIVCKYSQLPTLNKTHEHQSNQELLKAKYKQSKIHLGQMSYQILKGKKLNLPVSIIEGNKRLEIKFESSMMICSLGTMFCF